mmetsp:Transcript_44686/g.127503  ORF Transcript_44686/g.127503 Transcript_44686/m.127503 type:complete len:211 (+) Transcript_44686:1415-2047(+)
MGEARRRFLAPQRGRDPVRDAQGHPALPLRRRACVPQRGGQQDDHRLRVGSLRDLHHTGNHLSKHWLADDRVPRRRAGISLCAHAFEDAHLQAAEAPGQGAAEAPGQHGLHDAAAGLRGQGCLRPGRHPQDHRHSRPEIHRPGLDERLRAGGRGCGAAGGAGPCVEHSCAHGRPVLGYAPGNGIAAYDAEHSRDPGVLAEEALSGAHEIR